MGTEKHFSYTRYSPLIGMEALDHGILERIRWDLVTQEGGLDPEGRRKCGDDRGIPDDPHFKLIKELFPSGTCEFESKDFGFDQDTLWKTMARIMVYGAQVRDHHGKPKDLQNLIKADPLLQQKNIQTLVNLVEKAILQEKRDWGDTTKRKTRGKEEEGSSSSGGSSPEKERPRAEPFYPKYFVELILSAYVCDVANTQEDIESYIRAIQTFDSERLITKKNMEEVQLKVLSSETLDQVSDMTDPYAQRFFNRYLKNMYSPLPYQDGVTLSQNGSTNPVKGPEGELDLQGETFQNCAEEALKHLFNILLFDPITRTFDLSHLGEARRGQNRIAQIQEFYKIQGINEVNSTDKRLKNAWNRVMGDLNSLESALPPVKYKRKSENEILSGLINQIHVLERVLGQEFLSLDDKKEEDLTDKDVRAAWQKAIFFIGGNGQKKNTFSNNFKLRGDLKKIFRKDSQGQPYPDQIGDITVTLEDTYQFVFRAFDGHSYVLNQIKLTQNNLPSPEKFSLPPASFVEDLFMMGDKEFAVQNPAYMLFQKSSRDSASIRDTFKDVFPILFKNHKKFLEVYARNVIPRYAWNDNFSSLLLMEILQPLLAETKSDFLMEVLKKSSSSMAIDIAAALTLLPPENLWIKRYLDFIQTRDKNDILQPSNKIFRNVTNFFLEPYSKKIREEWSKEFERIFLLSDENTQNKLLVFKYCFNMDESLRQDLHEKMKQDNNWEKFAFIFSCQKEREKKLIVEEEPNLEFWRNEFPRFLEKGDKKLLIFLAHGFTNRYASNDFFFPNTWTKEIVDLIKTGHKEILLHFTDHIRTPIEEEDYKSIENWQPVAHALIASNNEEILKLLIDLLDPQKFRQSFVKGVAERMWPMVYSDLDSNHVKFILYRWPEELAFLKSEGAKFPEIKKILDSDPVQEQ
jgi:hypothetical protein